MTTAAADRELLREWRDRHGDVRPDRDGHVCVRLIWIESRCAGQCGQTSKWIVRGRPMCEECTVERIRTWLGEVSE